MKGFRRLKGYADLPPLGNALRARAREFDFVSAEGDRQVAASSLEPPLNFNSRRDIPLGSTVATKVGADPDLRR